MAVLYMTQPLFHLRHFPFSYLDWYQCKSVWIWNSSLKQTCRRFESHIWCMEFVTKRGCCNTRCKGSSTPYCRPQVAGLQKFAKFPAGESVTPREAQLLGGDRIEQKTLCNASYNNPSLATFGLEVIGARPLHWTGGTQQGFKSRL